MYHEVELHRRSYGMYALIMVPNSTVWLNADDLVAELRENCDGLCEI
jgi:hypothetical protein